MLPSIFEKHKHVRIALITSNSQLNQYYQQKNVIDLRNAIQSIYIIVTE